LGGKIPRPILTDGRHQTAHFVCEPILILVCVNVFRGARALFRVVHFTAKI